ncbi:MAG: electron transport complex subunit E [Thermodesulfobacteriota bacterium]
MAESKGIYREFIKGLWDENPVIRMLLGMCPTLAVTNSVTNGLAMGVATTFVLLSSSIIASLIKGIVPTKVRIPTYVVIIAGFVTMADLFLKAQFPPISKALGPYVPLIIVNCIILGRVEVFASRHSLGVSIADSFGMGIGFTSTLVVLGAIREILGSGSFFGLQFLTESIFTPWVVMILPAGAFLTLGLLIGIINFIKSRSKERGHTNL